MTNNSVSFQSQYSLPLGMGDLERFFVREFLSSFAGRSLAATLTLAPLLALAAPATPWQKLAPT
ncbi:MAG TPA: hypothetical protein VFX55_21995, partial [Duganella sp.]|nr:hypothetical protein [Duganella sp.]